MKSTRSVITAAMGALGALFCLPGFLHAAPSRTSVHAAAGSAPA